MLRVIREVRPEYVVGENVAGLISWNKGMVFNEVQTDLENEGYEVWAVILPACAVDAPHRRDRVWFVAHRSNAGAESVRFGRENAVYGSIATANAKGDKTDRNGSGGFLSEPSGLDWERTTANAEGSERQCAGGTRTRRVGSSDVCATETAANANGSRRRQLNVTEESIRQIFIAGICDENAANPTGGGRLQVGSESEPGHTAQNIPDWREFPTESPVCGRNDGIPGGLAGITVSSHRRNSLKAYGNAIVPQVAYQIFKAIQQSEPC